MTPREFYRGVIEGKGSTFELYSPKPRYTSQKPQNLTYMHVQ
jgi:hypothetical protein